MPYDMAHQPAEAGQHESPLLKDTPLRKMEAEADCQQFHWFFSKTVAQRDWIFPARAIIDA